MPNPEHRADRHINIEDAIAVDWIVAYCEGTLGIDHIQLGALLGDDTIDHSGLEQMFLNNFVGF